MDNSELQKRHFAALKEKYQVGQYKTLVSDSFLYLILRKADLSLQITNLEFQWLAENHLFRTVEIISLQQYQAEDQKRLEAEFLQLRSQYHIPAELELALASPVYSILWKIDAGCPFTDSDLELLNSHGLADTVTLIQDVLNFSKLKVDHKATQHLNILPEEPLYSILKKLDVKEPLSDSEADWLLEHDFGETLEIHWRQENERTSELEFAELKSKYRVDSHPDTSISSPLYSILKKLKAKKELEDIECEWLDDQKLTQLISIDRNHKDKGSFAELKDRYKATQYKNSDPSSRLFSILKNLLVNDLKPFASEKFQISEEDIQWLSKEGLTETVEIAKQIHFRILKIKYQMVGQLAIAPFYEIMLKLEREERLDSKQVIQLIEEGRLSRHGKIAIAYYRLEAIFGSASNEGGTVIVEGHLLSSKTYEMSALRL